MKRWILAVLCLQGTLFFIPSAAQTDSTQTKKNKPHVKIGAFYNSGLNFFGRTDSLRSQGYFPVGELWFSDRFYISAAPVFITNKQVSSEYAGTVLSAIHRFYKEKKYSGYAGLIVPVYRSGIELPQSVLKAQLTGNYSRLNKIMNITIGGDLRWSDKMDYGLSGAIDHLFRKETKSGLVLVADPTATVYAGTQQFSYSYYKQIGVLGLPGSQQQVTEHVNRFNILSYEFSMPLILAKGRVQVIAIPAYVIPQNLLKVAGRPDLTETGQNMFYVTAGIKLKLL